MKLTREQLDAVLNEYCSQIGLSCTDLHEDAFCVQSSKGYWLYLWYDGDENVASEFIREIEKLIVEEKLNLRRSQP